MFVGHEAVAFAAVGLLARRLGVSRERALALGVAAALFAAVPDVDMAYAPVGLLDVHGASPLAAANAFWTASTAVHRTVTHSVLLAPVGAVTFALVAARPRRASVAATALGVGLVALAAAVTGPLGAFVMALYVLAGVAIAVAAARRLALGPRAVALTALVGLASHPFGDLLTGTPPHFLYPLPIRLFAARPAVSPDPTVDLLAAFALELACIWAGVYAYHALTGSSLRSRLDGRAVAGAGYALVALVLTPPTLTVSYPFVFSVVAVGAVGAVPGPLKRRLPSPADAAVTGLAAVTVAALAYAAVYYGTHVAHW